MSAKLKRGDRVSTTLRYSRRNLARGCFRKEWAEIPHKVKDGIFLGYRTISNGALDFCGDYTAYKPDEYFKVALISPSASRNNIYVPIRNIGGEG